MTLEEGLRIVHIAGLAASAALSLYLYLRTAEKAKVDAIERQVQDATARIADYHTRLSVLETQMEGAPKHGDLVAIRVEMQAVTAIVSAINERSESTQAMVTSIQMYLMEGSRK